jgi:predicted Holliday junction resolvase-like endonuclease
MIYFILTIFFLILTGGVYLLYRKIKKMKKEYYSKVTKFDDDDVMKDLRSLRKQLLVVNDAEKRIEIIKKIELISRLYN